jgi:hypothetical protein
MIRPGQTTAAEASGVEAKVAAVLLDHHVGGDLRSAEDAVKVLIDRHILPDSLGIGMSGLDLPSRRKFA